MNEAETLYRLFLAIVMMAATQATPSPAATPAPDSISEKQFVMGAEYFNEFHNIKDQTIQFNGSWIRFNSLFWNEVEPNQGERKWTALSELETNLIAASQRGLHAVVVVRKSPAWAQSIPGQPCSPPKPGALPAFAAFMRDVVTRYGNPPFNVKHWEIGNEVDLDPSDEGSYGVWGCWGNKNDDYFGGGYYADMLKAIYPAMKSADASAQVLIGGLLLECDENFRICRQNRFLEGIVRNGGGPYFDGVGYHAYDFFGNATGKYSSPNWESYGDTTGPVLVAKLKFLQSVLNQYNVQGKYFMMTEGSILCWSCYDPIAEHEMTKAYYVPQMFAASMQNNLKAVIWYSYNSQWMQSSLVRADGGPLPAHVAMQVLHQKMADAIYLAELTPDALQSTKVRGYKFSVKGKEVWLVWGLTQDNVLVTLPAAPAAITDVLGNAQPAARAFVITPKPLYIEW
jgi:hypothetical protein